MSHSPPAANGPEATVRDPARLGAVRRTGLLDTAPEEVFDRLTRMAARIVGAPATFISLVDEERDFYKSCYGFGEPLATMRQMEGTSFCHYAVQSDRPLVIPDTRADPVYREVPTVESLGVAAYLGVPLVEPGGQVIGSFCAIDFEPREWAEDDVALLTELAASAMREIRMRGSLEQVEADRARARSAEERIGFLSEAGDLLYASLDYAGTLTQLAHLAVPRLADWCVIDVLAEDGTIERLAVAHPDPAKEALARDVAVRYPPDPHASHGVPQVLRTGEPELVPEIPPSLLEVAAVDAEHLRILRELDLRAYMIVPLIARGRTLGAITLIAAESGRRYDGEDLRFAQALAERAAVAVDNARLYQEAQSARLQSRRILESITDAFFALDREWRFTYVNDEAETVLRRTRDELLGRSIWEAFPDAVGSTFWEQYHLAVAEQRTAQFEELYRPLGTWLEVRAYPSAEGLSVYLRDVTDRHLVAEALRESEERYRFLANAVPQQIWITRPDGYHEYYNDRWYEYTGVVPGGAAGTGWTELLHPEDHARTAARWRHSLETGEPYSIEYRFRRHDGEYRWFLGQALPQRDEHGAIVRWFGTLTDIQDRKEAEAEREHLIAALETEQARLQSVFAQAPAAIAVTRGPEHLNVSANPIYRELVGRRELIGKTVREAFPDLEGQHLFELLDEVYRTGEAYVGREVEVSFDRDGDGRSEQAYFDFVYQPLLDPARRVTGIMTFAVEVTDQVTARREVELKAAELARLARQLEASNRELDQFAYVASHDLKAPLRGIANLSQWIEEDLEGAINEEVGEHLTLLRGRVHRMEGLIDGILEYSRAGRVRDTPEPLEVAELIAEAVDLLDPPEGYQLRIGEGMPRITTERLPLEQVFMNLIGNALKYNRRPDARVEVTVREAGDYYEFSVADNGPGIAPEYHERIFGIFQTLQARDDVEGTGIGLSLVRKLVESRGGQIRVESAVGEGAVFRFTWPRRATRAHEPS